MFCTGCGNVINDGDRFCKVCGTRNLYSSQDGDNTRMMKGSGDGEATEKEYNAPADYSATSADTVRPNDTVKPIGIVKPVDTDKSADTEKSGDTVLIKNDIYTDTIQPEVIIAPVEQPGHNRSAGNGIVVQETVHTSNEIRQTKLDKKKSGEKAGAGLMTGSVFLSIFAFLIILVFIVTLFVRTIISEDAIHTAVQEVDYSDIRLGDMLAEEELDISIEEDDTTLDIVYDALVEYGEAELSRGDLEQIFAETTFNEYISEKLTGYARYAVTGGRLDEITAVEITDLVEDNRNIIEDIIDVELTDRDLDELEEYLEKDGILDSFSAEEFDKSIVENKLDKMHLVLSDTVLMIILAASAAILLADMLLIAYLHKRFRAELNFIGFPMLFAGLLFTAAMLTVNIIKSGLYADQAYLKDILEPVIGSFFGRGILIGGISFIAGIIMVAGYIIVRKVENYRRQTGISEA